ncbi:MAG TPA: hypothetical protein VFZ71_11415, partial [Pyrinomonadaceae bacterium]
ARGGFEVDLGWNNGALSHAKIRSVHGTVCHVRYRDKVASFRFRRGSSVRVDANLSPLNRL